MKRNSSKKKTVLIILAAILIFSISSSVFAEPNPDLPNSDEKGSITVHKYATATESQTPGTGQMLDPEDAANLGTPLKDAGFTLYQVKDTFQVKYDTTPALAKANAVALETEKLTDGSGTVSWTDLPVGYYVLSETKTPDGYEESSDIIIRLPLGIGSKENKWNYDIHVYPKNIKTASFSKEVVNEMISYSAGETVEWVIDSRVSKTLYDSEDGGKYGSFIITDPLDSRLIYTDGSDVLIATGGPKGPIVMDRGTDYEVTKNGSEIKWSLTEQGMERFTESASGALSLTFSTVLDPDAADASSGSGSVIKNTASVYCEGADGTVDEKIIDDEDAPFINLAGIIINKVDSEDENIFLDGAVFKIAATEEDARAGRYIETRAGEHVTAVTGDNPETAETEKGLAIITGLPANPDTDVSYFLVEIEPPEGYVLRQSIIEVEIKAGDKTAVAKIKNQKIGNPPIDEDLPTFALPQTGGIGTLIFVAGGWTLIGLALLLFFKRRKDEEETQSR